MQENLGFFKVSSVVVKMAAWIFLFLGVAGAVSIMMTKTVPVSSRWIGVPVLLVYAFFFFFFYLVGKIADLLVKIVKNIEKE